MGDNADNVYADPDHNVVGGALLLVGVWPRIHRGSEGINERAPHQAVGTALAGLRSAGGVATFNTRMSAEYPNWWPALASRWGYGMWLAVTGQPG